MMNNNKILTVSYGTFSCTLEGFEDSFGTMKVIAEYFRDLAADDRYFGAEPPQPDAEMLAHIAQKEVSRKVEAREQDGKIMLSALEEAPVIEDAHEPASPVVTAAAAGAAAIALDAMIDAQPASEDVTEVTLEAQNTDIDEDAAEESTPELPEEATHVDVVSAADIETAEVEDVAEDVDVALTDAIADAEISAESAGIEDAAFVEDENDIVPGQPDADVGAFFAAGQAESASEVAETQSVASAVSEPASPASVAPDSIAAKLQRIRAVVAQKEEDAADEAYLEDEHAEYIPSADSDPQAEVADEDEPEMEAAQAPDVAEDAVEDVLVLGSEEAVDDTAELEKDIQATADDADDTSEDVILDARADIEEALDIDEALEAEEAEVVAEDDAEDLDAMLSRFDAQNDEAEEAEAALEDTDEDEVTEADTAQDSVNNLFEAEATTDVVETGEAEVEAAEVEVENTAEQALAETTPNPATRTRVIKVKRADLEAAIEKGDLEEYEDDAQDDALAAVSQASMGDDTQPGLDDLAPAKSRVTALSPDQQDELARELAALEDDIAKDNTTTETARADASSEDVAGEEIASQEETTDEADEQRRPSSRGILPNLDERSGSAVSRLLAETDHQMDEPESATRRDAFAHLRAAVAAKKADDSMNGASSELDGDDAYREDLAEAVRPRRPISRNPQTERPAEQRTAPLKLVAEQRIDPEDTVDAGPVTPRRVASTGIETTPASPAAPESGFSEFASEMGATTLPQLLEAAAAYMSFVEGREQFSRPQLMTKVRQAEGQEGFSREDGLRSFGQLLRAGKIEKLKGGRFTVSEDIGFRPDQRAAG